jgi:hypothetical protein
MPDKVATLFTRGLVVSSLVCGISSTAIAQTLHVEAGAGVATSTTSLREGLLHGYVGVQKNRSNRFTVGLDLSADLNDDRVCLERGCVLQFPNVTGLAAPVSLRESRMSFGIGPGIFYLHGSVPDHEYAGGIAGHADVALVQLRAVAVILSLRPMWVMGPARSNGDRVVAIPITLGVRW